jgi:hypothetical protein
MLWNAAQDYSGIKRMQRRNEQEKGEEKETTIRDCIGVSSAALLNIIIWQFHTSRSTIILLSDILLLLTLSQNRPL